MFKDDRWSSRLAHYALWPFYVLATYLNWFFRIICNLIPRFTVFTPMASFICTGINCRHKPNNHSQATICNEFKQERDNNRCRRMSWGWGDGLVNWVWGWILPRRVNISHCVLHFYCGFDTNSGKGRQIDEIWTSINSKAGSIGDKRGWIFRSATLNNPFLWQILKYLGCRG